MRLGNKIATRRKELGYTQQELADKLYVSVKTISKWETNRGNPEISNLPKIAEVLQIEMSELFDEAVDEEEQGIEKRKYDLIYVCFTLGFAFLGLLFFATTFITVESSITIDNPFFDDFFGNMPIRLSLSGYKILFSTSGTNFLGGVLVLCIWLSFLIILANVAFGIIELMVTDQNILNTKDKTSYITSIVGVSAIGFVTIFYIISSATVGFGMIFVLLLFGVMLGYNIKYKKSKLTY